MNRITSIAFMITCLLILLLLASSCGSKKDSAAASGETTDAGQGSGETSGEESPDPQTDPDEMKFQTNLTELKQVSPAKESEHVEGEGFEAETSGDAWSINSGVDFTVYNFGGGGESLIKAVEKKYPGAKIKYYLYDNGTGSKSSLTLSKVAQLSSALAFFKKTDAKNVSVYIQTIDPRAQIGYKSIAAGQGYYVMIPFVSNVPADYSAVISEKSGATSGKAKFSGMTARGKKGEYSGSIHFTVPYIDAGDYYINLIADKKCIASVPLKISESKYTNYEYHVIFDGAWDLIADPGYQNELFKLFYNTYPRLYARWGLGTENKTVTFIADPEYDGVAYSMGTEVVVAVDYANENPRDIGFFSHEITHQVQAYDNMQSDWWIENMATYGGFRYFHWCNAGYVQVYKIKEDKSLWDYDGWEPYGGDGCKLFFSYMDEKWPTLKGDDGELKYGLIDAINLGIKQGRIRDDNPTKTGSAFNNTVKEITGLENMAAVRKQYADECKNGTWDFLGFGEFVDNYLTEDLPNCENPVYPRLTEAVHGKSADKLGAPVTEGENLALSGKILESAGYVNKNELPEKMIDGDLKTKWCCTGATDPKYCLDGAQYWAVIDLGEVKTFNTYTIYNTKTQETGGNMSEWELFISDDPENTEGWSSIDYQKSTRFPNIVSFNIGEVKARYLMIKVYNGDGAKGTVRLYELELFNV